MLILAGLVARCTGGVEDYVTAESARRMAAADGLAAKRVVVQKFCAKARFPEDTRRFVRFFSSHFEFEIALQKARAHHHAERLAKTRRLCLDRATWRTETCIDI